MAAIRGSDTRPERLLRRELTRLKLRYRLHPSDVFGRPDIVFKGPKVAVFCDGDFWHGRGWSNRPGHPEFKTHRKFWIRKIERNIARDLKVTRLLTQEGWIVLRFWETDLRRNPGTATRQVASALGTVRLSRRDQRRTRHLDVPRGGE